MKRYYMISRIVVSAVFALLAWQMSLVSASSQPSSEQAKQPRLSSAPQKLGYIEKINFEATAKRERVIISLSQKMVMGLPKQQVISVEDQPASILLKLEDMFVPEKLRHPLGQGLLSNVQGVLPRQITAEGKQWVYLTVHLKEKAPYSIRQEGSNIWLDINVASLPERTAEAKAPASPEARPQAAPAADLAAGGPKDAAGMIKVSLDLQDASIKSVLRLLAEMAEVNIVAGEEVKGNVTVNLKNIPWEMALDLILEINSLGKRRVDNVVIVMPLDRLRKMEEEARKAELERRRVELEKAREELAIEKERERLKEEQERRRLALERERLDLEAKARADRAREEEAKVRAEQEQKVKPVEPGTEVFIDLDIRKALNLLAEEMRRKGEMVSIVASDEVKGTVSADFKEVPWEQRLDTILEIRGLAKRRTGGVITVMTLERMRREESERAAVEEARRKAELERKEREQKMHAEQMKLEQDRREKEQKFLAEQMKIEQAKRKEQEELTRPPIITRVVAVSYADAKSLKENLEDLLKKSEKGDGRSSVRVDGHSNSLIIQATREELAKAEALIKKVDKRIPQIQIKANIVETSKDMARELGIRWGWMYGEKVGGDRLFITPGGTGGTATPPGSAFAGTYSPTSVVRGIAGQGFGVNFPAALTGTASASLGVMFGTIGGNILEMQLSALQKDGKLKIISSPQITTLDNQMAFTENGEQVPYVTRDKDGQPLVKFHDAVLRLEITPNTIDEKNLKMKIVIKKDEVDSSRTVDGNPFIVKKNTETSLIVGDGETVLISGLAKQRSSDSTAGLPWFKNIPGLGWLFKHESTGNLMEEVIIFLTPEILRQAVVTGIQTGPELDLKRLAR